jgi:hypothetical protein
MGERWRARPPRVKKATVNGRLEIDGKPTHGLADFGGRSVTSWRLRVRTTLGFGFLLVTVAALLYTPTAHATSATLVVTAHRDAAAPNVAFTIDAFNGASVAEILGPVLPYLRPGDIIDLGNDTKENQTNITLLNAWATELHERLPPGVNITARVENLSNVQEAAQNLSSWFGGITLDYEKNRTFIPDWTYNFSAAVNYFQKATSIVHTYLRTAIAYPTGIPLNQSYGWNYATLANITDREDLQTQGFDLPSKWAPVITKLVGQFTNASVPLDRLTPQITLGAHKAGTRGNSQNAANATWDINFALNDSIHSIYLWWGLSAQNESILLHVLQNFRTPHWSATVAESGLPEGTNWSVRLADGQSASTNGSAVSFFEPNGTYSFTATSNDSKFASVLGSFLVNGGDVWANATFAPVTYPVSFTEQGLPIGSSWYLNFSEGSSFTSQGTTISFPQSNGTYDFVLATSESEFVPTNPIGSLVVDGAPRSLTAVFDQVAFTVTFRESGLPSKTNWSVSIGEMTRNSSSNLIEFPVASGSYPFTVAGPSDYQINSPAGTFSVAGAPSFVNVTFVKLHLVTIGESGLPVGTRWSVTVNGSSETSTTGNVTFQEVNGSYGYEIGSAGGYGATPANGTFSVRGDPLSMSVAFLKIYRVTFSESTLPVGSNWSVALTGAASYVILSAPLRAEPPTLTRWSDGASVIQFYVSTGNYTYLAHAATELNISGTVVVSGQSPPTISIPFPSGSVSSPGHGAGPAILPGWSMLDTPILLGAVGIAAAVAALVVLTRRRRRRSSGHPDAPPAPPEEDDVWDHP